MKRYALIASVVTLAGCANNVWVHPSKNNAQFNQDKNDCIVQAGNAIPREIVPQQPSPPPAYTTNCVGGYGSASCTTTPKVQPNYNAMAQSIADGNTNRARENFFSNCMQSRGWTLQTAESVATMQAQSQDRVEQYKAAMQSIEYEVKQMCGNPMYSAYFSKTSCLPADLTLSQLSDPTKATKKEKEAISAVDALLVKIINERADVAVKYMTPQALGNEIGAFERKAGDEFQKLRLDLYAGKITWGQFNSSRKNMTLQLKEQYKLILKKYSN